MIERDLRIQVSITRSSQLSPNPTIGQGRVGAMFDVDVFEDDGDGGLVVGSPSNSVHSQGIGVKLVMYRELRT